MNLIDIAATLAVHLFAVESFPFVFFLESYFLNVFYHKYIHNSIFTPAIAMYFVYNYNYDFVIDIRMSHRNERMSFLLF